MKCPECQLSVPDDSYFCNKCGCQLVESTDEEKSCLAVDCERKHVTIMFSDLSGYTAMTERLDPEEVKEIMSLIFGKIAEIIKGYDGFIERFIGDAVLAVFGIPKAHEDDPVRAIRAAMEIHAAVERLSPRFESKIGRPLSMHTGINTGLVVTGEVDVKKGNQGLTGDAINLASRLEGIAKAGEIVVGPDTYQQAMNYIEFDTLEPTIVKGKQEAVNIYKVKSVKKESFKTHRLQGLQADLTGREQEIALLAKAADRLKAGQGSIVSICGDAGTGKSRLIREFKDTLNLESMQWREGHAYSYTQSMPYYPLINLLTHVFQIEEGEPSEKLRAKVDSGVAYLLGEDNQCTPYVGSLFALTYPDIESVSPEFWKDKLQESIQAILAALIERGPTVVCFEDLHWADPSFIELFKLLLKNNSHKALFICIYRPPFSLFDSDLLAELKTHYTDVRLKDLPALDAQKMLKSLLNTASMPEDLQKFVQLKTEGNPFYLEEMINSLIESEILTRNNGNWQLTREITEADIPATIQGLLTARVDRLEKDYKRILQEASVIGRAFLYKILERISGIDRNIDHCIAGLEGLDLIRAQAMEPELEYIFKHALTQEVVYNGLLKKERHKIHERIASVMEELFQDRLEEFYEALAFHYLKSLNLDKALDYLMKSGIKCFKKFSLEESHRHYKEAFNVILDENFKDPNKDSLLVELLIRWAMVYYYQSDFFGLYTLLAEHEERALEQGDKAKTAMFLSWFGWTHWGLDNLKLADEYLSRGLSLGQEVNDPGVVGNSYAWLAWTRMALGRMDEAIELGDKAVQLAVIHNLDPYVHFKALGAVAQSYWYKGCYRSALKTAKRLVDYGDLHGSLPGKALGCLEVGFAYITDGDLPKAVEWFERIARESRGKDFIYSYTMLLGLGMGYVLCSETEKAELPLNEMLSYCGEKKRWPWLANIGEVLLGVTWITKGRMNDGMKLIKKRHSGFIQNDRKYMWSLSEYVLGNVYLQIYLGEGDLTLAGAIKNIGFLIKNVPFAAKNAENHFKRAIDLANAIGAGWVLAQSYFDLGRLYRAKKRNDIAREYITKAIDVFEQCDIESNLKTAKDFLVSLS